MVAVALGMVTVAAATAAVIDVSVSAVSSLGQCEGNLANVAVTASMVAVEMSVVRETKRW